MSLLTKSKQPLNTKAAVFMISPLKLALGLTCGIVLSAQAQIVANNGANVTQAANGTDIININRAGGHGVSYNTFDQFNVSQSGAVFNNATSEVNSQLTGGTIAANSQLGDTAAQIIIAQVNQGDRNRSRLNGAVEVTGSAADVIIANPAGITCDGCGFINTNSVSLVAGQVALDHAGKIDRYSALGERIEFVNQGLVTHTPKHLNLIAGNINFKANVKLQPDSTLTARATNNELNDDLRVAEWNFSRKKNSNNVHIDQDVTLEASNVFFTIDDNLNNFGEIKSEKSTVNAKEAIVNHGLIMATDEFNLRASHIINHKVVEAVSKASLKGHTENYGTIKASTIQALNLDNYQTVASTSGDLTLAVIGRFNNHGTLESKSGNLTLTVGREFNHYSNLNLRGMLDIKANEIHNYGTIYADDKLSIKLTYMERMFNSGWLHNAGLIGSAGEMSLSADYFKNVGFIHAESLLDLSAHYLDNYNTITGDTVKIKTDHIHNASTFSEYGQYAIIKSNENFVIDTGTLNNHGGYIQGSAGSITAFNMTNGGLIEVTNGLDLNVSQGFNTEGGAAIRAKDLRINTSSLNNWGTIESDGFLRIGAYQLNNYNTIAADDLEIKADGIHNVSNFNSRYQYDEYGRNATISGNKNFVINTGFLNNHGGYIQGNAGSITAFTIANRGLIDVTDELNLKTFSNFSNGGELWSLADYLAHDGVIGAKKLTIDANTLNNYGSIASGSGGLTINVQERFTNYDYGSVTASTLDEKIDSIITAGELINQSLIFVDGELNIGVTGQLYNSFKGSIESVGGAVLSADSLENKGVIQTGSSLDITAARDVINHNTVTSNGDLDIKAGNLILNYSVGYYPSHFFTEEERETYVGAVMGAQGNVTLTAQIVANDADFTAWSAPSIYSDGVLTVNSDLLFNQYGIIRAKDGLKLNVENIYNVGDATLIDDSINKS